MSDENGMPWEAEVLDAGPVEIENDTKVIDIVGPLLEKLAAVMSAYDCEPTPDGWRKLALHLVLDMQKGRRMVVKTAYSRREPGQPGRPPADPSWVWLIEGKIAKAQRRGNPITARQAAQEVIRSRKDAPSLRRLLNMHAERNDIKYTFPSPDPFLMLRAEEAIELAAAHLESQSRK